MDLYSASSLKQWSVDRHVTPLGHIILIPNQPVFALSPYCRVLYGEATNTNFIVFGLSRSRLEPTIYRTRCEHANKNTTDAINFLRKSGTKNNRNEERDVPTVSATFHYHEVWESWVGTKNVFLCMNYNAPILSLNLQRRSLACRQRGTLQLQCAYSLA